MKIIGIFLVALVALTGCASNSDIANLQGQIDTLKPQITQASSDAAAAKAAADAASAKAASAEVAANKAAAACAELSLKLDKVFKKAQYK